MYAQTELSWSGTKNESGDIQATTLVPRPHPRVVSLEGLYGGVDKW